MTIFLVIISFILAAMGLVGILLPVVPAVPLAWAGLLLFAYATGFAAITFSTILIFLGLSVLAIVLDVVAPLLGAKKYKAGKFGLLGSFLGTIVGVFFLGPLGIVIGPLVGAFVGEWLGGKDQISAWHSAMGTAVGILIGGLIKMILIMVMIGFMVAAIF